MHDAPSLFDAPAAQAAADQAIQQVGDGANRQWLETVEKIVYGFGEGTAFTSEDIWASLEANYPKLKTSEPRAMGAAVRVLARDGVIAATGTYAKGERVVAHGRPVAVWVRL